MRKSVASSFLVCATVLSWGLKPAVLSASAGAVLAALLALLASYVSAPPRPPEGMHAAVPLPEVHPLTLVTPTGWYLTILADGSGTVGYPDLSPGDSGSPLVWAHLPEGTLDLAASSSRLLPGSLVMRTRLSQCRVSTTGGAGYTTDGEAVSSLFARALAEVRPESRLWELRKAVPIFAGNQHAPALLAFEHSSAPDPFWQ